MKNILSTLAAMVILGISVYAATLLYQRAFKPEAEIRKLSPEEGADAISERLVEPFVKAWIARNTNAIKALTPGSFGGGMPSKIEYSIENRPPFEIKSRSSVTEEDRESTTDFDELFSCLLDPIYGLKNCQTQYTVSDATFVTGKVEDTWHFKLTLDVTGVNRSGGIKVFRSEQDVIAMIPAQPSSLPNAFRSWQINSETISQSDSWVIDQVFQVLAMQGVVVSADSIVSVDVADFDNDDDMDLALKLPGGTQFVFAYGDDTFEDATESLGMPPSSSADDANSMRMIWVDFNGDGFQDLISGDRIFENKNGTEFVDVTEQAGVTKLLSSNQPNYLGKLLKHFSEL